MVVRKTEVYGTPVLASSVNYHCQPLRVAKSLEFGQKNLAAAVLWIDASNKSIFNKTEKQDLFELNCIPLDDPAASLASARSF